MRVSTEVMDEHLGGTTVFVVHGLPKVQELIAGEGHFLPLVQQMGLPKPAAFAWIG